MNSVALAVIVILILYLGYRIYGGIMERLWDVDEGRATPAVELKDGIDYMPARHWTILFGHHFASIAGAGPIIGPVIAVAVWGWVPAVLWILIGCIFFGSVHDFSNLMASLKFNGRSISNVAESVLNRRSKVLLALFLWLTLILVIAVFAAVAAKTLSSTPEVVIPTFGLILVALFIGLLMYRWGLNQILSTLLGVALLFGLILLGYHVPVNIEKIARILGTNTLTLWILVLLIYAYIASILPVNILLQPRDYLATIVLFFCLGFGYIGIAITHHPLRMPAFIGWSGAQGSLWPMMFVIIACGAISGFHSLIATGTTSKQLANERDAKKIGYGGMILEGVLSALALISVSAGLYWVGGIEEGLNYSRLLEEKGWIGAFGAGYGVLVGPIFGGLGMLVGVTMLKTFVMTTLDSATRITRYITEELFGDGFGISALKNRYLSSAMVIMLAGLLALGNWKAIWPIFGASNQLVAALALIVLTVYLTSKGKPSHYTLYPCVIMLITTIAALIYQIGSFFTEERYLLCIIGIILLTLAGFMVWEGIRALRELKKVRLKNEP